MSLRFKALRSSSNYNKTQFADLMQVAYRTVTNWEKKDGVILIEPFTNEVKEC